MDSNKDIWENENADEQSVFDGDDISQEELLRDGTDYTDIVEKYKNRKRNTIIAVVCISIIAAVGIFFGSKYILENPEVEKPAPTAESTEPTEEIPSQSPDYTEPSNPVSSLFAEKPENDNDEITAFVENNTLQTSHGTIVSIENSEISSTIHKCAVRKSTDFCNVGTVVLNDTTYHSYYLKNAAESRFFEEPADFQEIEIPGIIAAILTIDTINGNSTPVLVVVEQDGTGFMFVSESNDTESLNTLVESVSVN